MEHAYHGDTIGTMSAGERGVFNAPFETILFGVDRLPFPEAGREQETIDAFETICRSGKVAAILIEPLVLGAGGMKFYGTTTLRALKEIASRYDCLFIADEVMTGWGRTGTRFACDQAGLTPDILCTSKGLTGGTLPLAATLCTTEIFEAHLSRDRSKTFFIQAPIRPMQLLVRRRLPICKSGATSLLRSASPNLYRNMLIMCSALKATEDLPM